MVTRPAMLPRGLEVPKWSHASSGVCSAFAITRNRVLFQRDPVGRSNQTLGRHKAGSRAAGNSFGANKFGNRLAIVLWHDPPGLPRRIGRAILSKITFISIGNIVNATKGGALFEGRLESMSEGRVTIVW